MTNDTVRLLRALATGTDHIQSGHAQIFTAAADEIERLDICCTANNDTKHRSALLWAFDRLAVDDMTKAERMGTMKEIANVLTGRPSPAATYLPNEWMGSTKLKSVK